MKHRVVSPRMMRLAVASALLTLAAGASAQDAVQAVPTPTVSGPIPNRVAPGDPSHDYTFLTTQEDLSTVGYVEQEFFLEGKANRYNTPSGATGSVQSSGHPYRTRIVVRRPITAERFNGTVLLEWQNVTAGYDIDAHWGPSWKHFVKNGYAWVGVSAQRVGVHGSNAAPTPGAPPPRNNGLKAWSPVRYGSLDVTAGGTVTDDALCYDIFSQAAQAMRAPGENAPLGPLKVKTLLAIGASQSAGRLSIYHNAIHPLHKVVDGYYLLVGGSSLRKDLGVKVFQYLSETDVRGGPSRRAADSESFRSWEVAGSAHSSYASEQYRSPLITRDFGQQVWSSDCDQPPYSRVKGYHVINVQYDLLVKWVNGGEAPPSAPKIDFQSDNPPVVARDERGIARGGIRLPDVEAPIALNSGMNSGATFCSLYGTYRPFDATTLRTLYPSKADYVNAVVASATRNLRAGYINEDAVAELKAEAEAAAIPPAP